MRKMKKTSLLFLLLLPFIILAACTSNAVGNQDISQRIDESDNPRISWGVKADTNLFGLYNIAEGEIQGFDIDIAKALTEEITGDADDAEFVEVTSKTRIPLLKNGNIDAIIATMTISPERLEQVNFSDVYFAAGQSLLVPNDSPIQGIEDLNENTTVLAVKGSTSAQNIREYAPEAPVLELENYSEAFTALKSGQGEAVTTDNAILLGIIAENPGYRLAGGPFTDEPYGIAIDKGQDNFLNEVNQALDMIIENGTYGEIFKKWFPEEEVPDL